MYTFAHTLKFQFVLKSQHNVKDARNEIQVHFNSYSYALAATDGSKDKRTKKSTGSQIGGYAAYAQ